MFDLEVLVVDDDPTSRQIVKRCLEDAQYKVTTASSGDEAIELLSEKVYDVVITDLEMPGSANGIGVLEYAKEQCDSTEVIIMTAYGSVKSAVDAIKKGASDYLIKPLDLTDILFRVQKISSLKCVLKDSLDLRMAIETTEQSTSETIQNLEMIVADFCETCCQMKKILGNESLGKEQRIKKASELLNHLAEKYAEMAHGLVDG